MSRVDRILELCDQALQHPGDQAYPTEHGDSIASRCWKCDGPGPLNRIDVCEGCAAWLRGEDVPEPQRGPGLPLGGYGHILRAAFGLADASSTDGPYTHTFVLAVVDPPPWGDDTP